MVPFVPLAKHLAKPTVLHIDSWRPRGPSVLQGSGEEAVLLPLMGFLNSTQASNHSLKQRMEVEFTPWFVDKSYEREAVIHFHDWLEGE